MFPLAWFAHLLAKPAKYQPLSASLASHHILFIIIPVSWLVHPPTIQLTFSVLLAFKLAWNAKRLILITAHNASQHIIYQIIRALATVLQEHTQISKPKYALLVWAFAKLVWMVQVALHVKMDIFCSTGTATTLVQLYQFITTIIKDTVQHANPSALPA